MFCSFLFIIIILFKVIIFLFFFFFFLILQVSEITELNKLASSKLENNQILLIPIKKKSKLKSESISSKILTHTVQEYESLKSIARYYNITVCHSFFKLMAIVFLYILFNISIFNVYILILKYFSRYPLLWKLINYNLLI